MHWVHSRPGLALLYQPQSEYQAHLLANLTASQHPSSPVFAPASAPWNAPKARFNEWCYPYLLNIPTLVAAIVVTAHFLTRVVGPFRRGFTPFIEEVFVNQKASTRTILGCPTWIVNLVAIFVLSCIGLASSIASLIMRSDRMFLGALPWAVVMAMVAFQAPKTTSYGLLAIFTTLLGSRLAVFINSHRGGVSPSDAPELIETVCAGLLTIALLCMPIRDPEADREDIAQRTDPTTAKLRSPEDDLSLWTWMTVWWMHPLIQLGRKRQLNDEDVWKLPYVFQHHRLHEAFRVLKGSVLSRLLKANWHDLVIVIIMGAIYTTLDEVRPLVFQQLLKAMSVKDYSKWVAIVYGLIEFLMRVSATQVDVLKLWFSRRVYERSRGEMIAMLYQKALSRKIINATTLLEPQNDPLANGAAKKKPRRIRAIFSKLNDVFWSLFSWKDDPEEEDDEDNEEDNKNDEPASSGKILNLMRNDAYEIAQRFWEIDQIVHIPLMIIISIVLIWKILGLACLLGAVAIIISQFLNGLIIKQMLRWEKKRRAATDKKLQRITQYISSIRHLRWEGSQIRWLDQILSARQRELILRVISGLWKIALSFVNDLGDDLFPVIAFLAYTVILKKELRVDVAFPAMDLFQTLKHSLMRVPDYVSVFLNAFVALKRIDKFMDEPDLEIKEEKYPDNFRQNDSSPIADVTFEGTSFAWPGMDSGSQPVLRNINASFQKGLTIIRGRIGSGKSALLQATFGELDLVGGDVIRAPGVKFGYCAQSPWLQNMSIRDNILFSTEYQEARYKQVLEACALTHDLAQFKHGDLSDIGENGIGLSGGQKARVALARAVYSTAQVLLLDDPLSALDLQTAQHVVRKLLSGPLLEHRTVVLVTHRIELCREIAYQILRIEDGTLEPESRASESDDELHEDEQRIEAAKQAKQQVEEVNEDELDAAVPDKFIEDEHRAKGGVQFQIYWEYVKAGNLLWWACLIVCTIYAQASFALQSLFLKIWGEAYELEDPSQRSNFVGIHLPPPRDDVKPWLLVFFFIGFFGNIAYVMIRFSMILISYTAGKKLFREIMYKVSYATWRFYDTTPVGRLMNRMTGDISTIDGNISQQLYDIALDFVLWGISIVIIASATPAFLIFSAILVGVFIWIFMYFLPTSQSLRRLEMVSLSPLLSNFGSLVDGLTTVRAFKVQHEFQDRVLDCVDMFQKHDHFYWSLQAWLMWRLDMLSACGFMVLVILAVYTNISAGLTAFVLINGEQLTGATRELCEDYGRLQMDFVSVERVIELLRLDQEDPGSLKPPASWPSYPTDIVFDDVSIRYAPHMELALKNLSLKIPGGKNTAIIGRTGSGKSTLASSILGTVIAETGRILVGGLDVSEVDKQTLRRKITFLPQDPLLLPGTIRHNLDHLEEYSDDACAAVLERVGGRYGWTLDTVIDVGGRNLSQGQRQLVGLARAVLRQSPVVIFDEATASIDNETTMHLVRILREELQQSTVITIAHRLETIEADWYIELNNGQVAWEGEDISQRDS